MAQTPPPFQPSVPPSAPATNSSNKACLTAVILVLAMCLVFIIIGAFFVKGVFGQVTKTVNCVAMFELADNAVMAYSKEHGGKLPKAETWQDDIRPYYDRLYKKMRSDEDLPPFMMPPASVDQLQCQWEGQTTGIAYNVDMSQVEVSKIKDPTTTVLLFETEKTGKNLALKYVAKPKSKAPKVMYNERDWIVYYIEGNKNPFESTNTGRAKSFKIRPQDAIENSPKSAPPNSEEENSN